MDFSRWKDIAELFGLVAIIASLVFVGLQLKQSQEIALANQYQARAQATQDLTLTQLEIGQMPYISAIRDGARKHEVEAGAVNTMLWLWIQMDNHYYQYQHGFLDEEAWQAQLNNIREIYATCRVRFVYDWRKAGLRESFVEIVESVDDPCAGYSEGQPSGSTVNDQ